MQIQFIVPASLVGSMIDFGLRCFEADMLSH